MCVALGSLVLAAGATAAAQRPAAKPAKRQTAPVGLAARIDPRALTGPATGGSFCVGREDTDVHNLGLLPSNTRITVEFTSDGDPVATLARYRTGRSAPNGLFQRLGPVTDDDGGGNLEPRIDTTMPWRGTAVLLVSSADNQPLCYQFRIVLR